MNVLRYVKLQFKLDFRNKAALLVYYIVPLIFFLFMGSIMSKIVFDDQSNFLNSMILFALLMSSSLGFPSILHSVYQTDTIKIYRLSRIPTYIPLISQVISSLIHMSLVSLIMIMISPLIFKVRLEESMMIFLIEYLMIAFACLSIGCFIGIFLKKTTAVNAFGQLIFLPSLMLSGMMFPKVLLPLFLQKISVIFPISIGNIVLNDGYLSMSSLSILILISLFFYMISMIKIHKEKNL